MRDVSRRMLLEFAEGVFMPPPVDAGLFERIDDEPDEDEDVYGDGEAITRGDI